MSHKLGLLGNGNMGYAILKGLISQGIIKAEDTAVYDPYRPALLKAEELGCTVFDNELAVVRESEIILTAIKPQNAKNLLNNIGEILGNKLLLSIVAGFETKYIQECLGNSDARILRIMPNTPAMVGAGVFGLNQQANISEAEKKEMDRWFSAIGRVEWVDESLFPVVTGLSGGGPAYVAMFIEALADGGVKGGLKRDVALRMAAQTVLGSAKLLLEGTDHPAVLKDKVCSPAGTTIEGVQALEDGGFRSTVIRAVEKSSERAKNLK